MRIATLESVAGSPGDELLTTGEAARILNTSRQHVVDLCDRGDLPFVTTGTHRRVRRADLEALRTRTERLTRDQQRSLWLGYAIAGWLVAAVSGEVYRLPLIVSARTYLVSAGVVVGSALASGGLVLYRLRRFDRVAVLKARE